MRERKILKHIFGVGELLGVAHGGVQVRYSLCVEMNTYIKIGADGHLEEQAWRPVLSGRALAISGQLLEAQGDAVFLVFSSGTRVEVPIGTYEIDGDILRVDGAPADGLVD